MAEAAKRCAVVTGSNKGIGFEICRQLASEGITVILTARDEKRGLEAVEKLKNESEFSDEDLLFHRLDVADPATIHLLVDFVKTRFGKLDILVNNAAVSGIISDAESLKAAYSKKNVDYGEIIEQTYELAKECLEINYYGVKRMCEAFIPLLMASDSPRIVNVSSTMGKLQNIPNEWAKSILTDTDNLTEERIDEVINRFLKDFKEGSVHTKGWPKYMSAYIVSKAAINAYTRILARNHPSKVLVNSVCPGFVKTDINYRTGFLSAEEGAESPVRLALLDHDGPSGCFFDRKQVSDL